MVATLADVVRGPHRPLWDVVAVPFQGTPVRITDALTEASLSIDATRWPRYRFSATVGDPSLFPTTEDDLLMPAGTRLIISTGLQLPDGTEWWQQQAVVHPDATTITRSRESGMQLVCLSVESRVSQAGFWQGDLSVPAGWTVPHAISEVLQRTAGPLIAFHDDAASTVPVPAGMGLSGDPWAALEDLARIAALELYVDQEGAIRLDHKPQLGQPVATLAAGPGGVLAESIGSVDRSSAANRVRIVYRSTDPGVPDRVGTAYLDDGPLRWDGPAGRMLYTDTRDGPVTQQQADAAAAEALRARSGWTRPLELLIPPDPRLRVGQTVDVKFLSGVTERHVLVSIDRELLPVGAMRLRTRGDFLALGSS